MTVVKIAGNTVKLNSTPTVVPLSNSYGANSIHGASCVYSYNSLPTK